MQRGVADSKEFSQKATIRGPTVSTPTRAVVVYIPLLATQRAFVQTEFHSTSGNMLPQRFWQRFTRRQWRVNVLNLVVVNAFE